MDTAGKNKERRWIFINWIILVFSVAMGLNGFYELFITRTGIHVPRIRFAPLRLSWDIPTVGWSVVLFCAACCAILSFKTLIGRYRSIERRDTRTQHTTVVLLFFTQLIAYLIVVHDFLSSAGSFG